MWKNQDEYFAMPFRTVAFLQNQWFKSPVSAQKMFDKHQDDPFERSRLVAKALFAGCMTGRRIRECVPNIDMIAWENTTTIIGAVSSSRLRPNIEHMEAVLDAFQPHVVLCFGRQAELAMEQVSWTGPKIITPHPAARPYPRAAIERAADEWRQMRAENQGIKSGE